MNLQQQQQQESSAVQAGFVALTAVLSPSR